MAPPHELDDTRLDAAIRAIARARSRELADHPSAVQLADYSLGLHAREEEELIQEHLALCPECAQAVLDLMVFGAAPAEADALDPETEREWERLVERLNGSAQLPVRTSAWAAAAVWGLAASLVVCLGLLAWGLRLRGEVSRTAGPSGDVVVADLVPQGSGAERTREGPVRVTAPPGGARLVLLLNLGDLRTFPRYRMELAGAHGEKIWADDDVQRSDLGNFSLILPVESLTAGSYEVRVFGVADAGAQLLAVYSFELVREEPRGPRGAAAAPDLLLSPGEPRAAALAGSRAATLRIALHSDDFAHVVVNQQGIDVVAVLLRPGGRPLLTVDSPNGAHGPEHLFLVADEDGEYRLEIRPFNEAAAGRFSATLARRPATADDRRRADACRVVSEGDAALARDQPDARQQAVERYEHALKLFNRVGERYPAMVAHMKLGRAWSREGNMQRAVEHWEAAFRSARALGLDAQVSSLHNDLGFAYQRLGEADRARTSYEAAFASARTAGDLREETVSLNNLALLEERAGEPWRALLLFDEALTNWRTLREATGEATTLHNMGSLFTALGRLPEARDALEQALRLHRVSGNRRQEATTAMALGWVRCLEGDFVRGRRDLLWSLALRREVGDRRGEAVTLDRLGSASREAGRPARAVREYEAAWAIFREGDDRRSEANTLSNFGDALVRAGKPAAGLGRLESALPLLLPLGDPSAISYAYFRRAKARRALGDPHGASADLREALTRLESVRAGAESGALRTSYLASVHEQYELAIDLAMDLHGREPAVGHDRAALDLAERARARTLLDLLTQARSSGVVATALAQDGDLRRVERSIRAFGERSDGADGARLRRLLFEREKLLVELRAVAVGERDVAPVIDSLAIQRRVLDRDTLLLVYALGEDRSFVWAVTREQIASAVLPPRAEVEAAVGRLLRLSAKAPGRGMATQAPLVGAEVAKLLLGGIAHRLGDHRLAIVADGVLARVPFSALPDPRGSGRPLVERHEIVVLPSASALEAVRRRTASPRPLSGLVAVVADPVFSRDDERFGRTGRTTGNTAPVVAGLAASTAAVTRAARDLGLRGFARVPFTRQEAAAIVALAPSGQTLQVTGAAANRSLVIDGRLRRYRIVHFATHALLHPQHPELSGLVLSLYDRDGRPQDGFLRSYEIADLSLPVDLVVLSACRTGGGKEVRGEGMVGLTQSFLEAGAAAVLASLWDVDDEATARLMERFYRELLAGGRSPAAALRSAQRSLRADPRWAAPYYWAGFVLAGEWRQPPRMLGDRVSHPRTLPRLAPGDLREEITMDRTSKTQEGSTPGEDNIVKGDKSAEPEGDKVARTQEGSEPDQQNDPKPTDKGV